MRKNEIVSMLSRARVDSTSAKAWCRVDYGYPLKPEWQQVTVIAGGYFHQYSDNMWVIVYGHPLAPSGFTYALVRSSRLRKEKP